MSTWPPTPIGYTSALLLGAGKGGAGSGNYGHSGRPGEVGGSGAGGGGGSSQNAGPSKEIARRLLHSTWADAAMDMSGGNDMKADRIYNSAPDAADFLGDRIHDEASKADKYGTGGYHSAFREIVDGVALEGSLGAKVAKILRQSGSYRGPKA